MPAAAQLAPRWPASSRRWAMAALGILILVLLCLLSLSLGARPIAPSTVLDAFLAYDGQSMEHVAVRAYRVPRTLLGLACGAAFGVSGAIMQAVTRNALADPGLLGVNAGAAFFVTIAAGVLGIQAIGDTLWFALLGAIVVTVLVYALGSLGRAGPTPLRLLLAGVAVGSVLGGLGSAIVLLNPVGFESMRVWSIGALSGRDMGIVSAVTPFILLGLAIAAFIAPALNAMALGSDNAQALGTHVIRTRVMSAVAVTLLAGAGTAAVGPIGFIGLMTPHAVRALFGPDQRLIIGGTMIVGPILLLSADILGRFLIPGELEAGVVTAFLGAPILILLVQRQRVNRL